MNRYEKLFYIKIHYSVAYHNEYETQKTHKVLKTKRNNILPNQREAKTPKRKGDIKCRIINKFEGILQIFLCSLAALIFSSIYCGYRTK